MNFMFDVSFLSSWYYTLDIPTIIHFTYKMSEHCVWIDNNCVLKELLL